MGRGAAQTPDQRRRLERALRLQDGLLTADQCREVGLSPDVVSHRCRPGGPWQRVLPRVVATHNGPLSDRARARASLLLGGDGAQLSGATACALYRLPSTWSDGPVHLLVPRARQLRSRPRLLVVHSGRLSGSLLVEGLRCAPAARAVADAVRAGCDADVAQALTAEAVQRGRCSVEALTQELREGPRRGSALLRDVLDDLSAGTRSAAEAEFRGLVRSSRVLPEPLWNAQLLDASGQPVAVVDALWPDADLVAEVDSFRHHGSPAAFAATLARAERLEALGLHVVSLAPVRLRGRRDRAELLGHLEALHTRYHGTGGRAAVVLGHVPRLSA